jgi:hypothetical protein
MIRPRQAILLGLAALAAEINVLAQNPPSGSQKADEVSHVQSPAAPNAPADTPDAISPVSYFRKLLAMSPQEREDCLTNRPPQTRERILVKVHEYEMLSPDERELRLRATELRWYLMPMLQMDPAQRDARMTKVPADLRDIVKARLSEWEILPPPLKQEFLENERTLYYFARVQAPANSAAQQIMAQQRQQISAQFNQFLELTPEEKAQTLSTLSTSEREQMQKTLESFRKLPPEQQTLCVQNYAKFAEMSAADRAEFLRNAEHWSQMSPAERQTWRDLVSNVPDWPPLPASIFPPGFAPSVIPAVAGNSRPSVATN